MQRAPSSSRRTAAAWARRAGLTVIGAAVSLFVLYVVAINVFLSTSLFDKAVNAKPMTIDVHFRRGWSVWPGVVHARDLSIRSRDGNVEFMLRIDRVRFHVSPAALAQHRFAVRDVQGSGVSFRLRSRLDPWETTPERLQGLPPIQGLSAVPVRPYKQCSLVEGSDAAYNLWTIDLRDVRAEGVRELWIDRHRFEGEFAAAGRFYLRPVRAVEVGPLHVDADRVQLSEAGTVFVERIAGTADLTIDLFDPRVVAGHDVPQRLSLATDFHATVPDIGHLGLSLPEGARASGSVDLRKIAVHVEQGHVRSGSRVEADAPRALLTRGEDRIAAALSATAEVADGDAGVTLRGFASDARYTHGAADGPPLLVAARIEVTGEAPPLVSGEPVEVRHVTVASDDLQAPDLRALAAAAAHGAVPLESGHARSTVRLEAWPGEARAVGRASMQAEDVAVRDGDLAARANVTAEVGQASYAWQTHKLGLAAQARIAAHVSAGGRSPSGLEGDMRAFLQARSASPDGTTLDVSGTAVAMHNVSVGGTAAPASYGDAILQGATLQLAPPRLRGVVSADVVEATPLLAGVRGKIPGPFQKLTDIPRLLASARLSYSARGGRVRIDDIDAHGGLMSARGVFGARAGDRLGAFLIEGGPVAVGLGLDPEGTHIHIFGLSGWLVDEQQRVAERIGTP